MFKIIFAYLITKHYSKNQLYLNLGAHFLKKGCSVKIGEILSQKHITPYRSRVKYISNLFYDFKTNSITHACENGVIDKNEKGR